MTEPEIYAMLALVLMELQKINQILDSILVPDQLTEIKE